MKHSDFDKKTTDTKADDILNNANGDGNLDYLSFMVKVANLSVVANILVENSLVANIFANILLENILVPNILVANIFANILLENSLVANILLENILVPNILVENSLLENILLENILVVGNNFWNMQPAFLEPVQ